MLGKVLLLKATSLLVFFFFVNKVFEKRVDNRIVNHLEKCGLFFISTMILGVLDQLQIFRQFSLIELLGSLAGLQLLEL